MIVHRVPGQQPLVFIQFVFESGVANHPGLPLRRWSGVWVRRDRQKVDRQVPRYRLCSPAQPP